ncbi:MAG: DUF2804 domain-containing protein [Bradymonadales bacterium]|nr:DUF2804 domain-containing protein [Bradymonadales bacterium]
MSQPLRPLLDATSEVVTDGSFNLGTYGHDIPQVNPLDARIAGRFPLPRAFKSLRLKEWEHFALASEDHYISLALFNAKTLALAQVCIYSRRDGAIYFYERKAAPWKMRIPQSLDDSQACYRSSGFFLSIKNQLANGRFELEFDIAPQRTLPAVSGHFIGYEQAPTDQPIVVVLPLKKHKAMYSHKYVCPVEGSLSLNDRQVEFPRRSSYGLIDIHKGYYPWVMKWHWATGGFFDGQDRLVGFNLTDNQVEDQDRYNENCLWIDGKLFLLPPVRFHFDPHDPLQPWTIADRQGMVELTFTPEVIRTVDINALVIRSRYRGPFGAFHGRLRSGDGPELAIEKAFGMCEDFYLRT